eukprot:COSAG01_NODE_21725_length_888_cov_0.987326_1_plen_72_part_00
MVRDGWRGQGVGQRVPTVSIKDHSARRQRVDGRRVDLACGDLVWAVETDVGPTHVVLRVQAMQSVRGAQPG